MLYLISYAFLNLAVLFITFLLCFSKIRRFFINFAEENSENASSIFLYSIICSMNILIVIPLYFYFSSAMNYDTIHNAEVIVYLMGLISIIFSLAEITMCSFMASRKIHGRYYYDSIMIDSIFTGIMVVPIIFNLLSICVGTYVNLLPDVDTLKIEELKENQHYTLLIQHSSQISTENPYTVCSTENGNDIVDVLELEHNDAKTKFTIYRNKNYDILFSKIENHTYYGILNIEVEYGSNKTSKRCKLGIILSENDIKNILKNKGSINYLSNKGI